MTGPAIPSLPQAAPLEGEPTPALAAPTPVLSAPVQGTPTRSPKIVSPFYFRYLNDQATAIRARAIMAGEDENAAVNQFLDMEESKPLGLLPQPTDDLDVPTNLRGVSMGLVQGATFGFGDEAIGSILGLATGVGAAGGIEEYRREYAEWAQEHGKTAFLAELAGGLATGGAGGAAKAGLGRVALRAGAAGALAGAGYADGDTAEWNIGQRTKAALFGGALAAATGGAMSGLGSVLKPIVRPLAEKVVGSKAGATTVAAKAAHELGELVGLTPEQRARVQLAHALEADNLTPELIAARAAELQATGTAVSILEVGGDAVHALARRVLSSRSPVKNALAETMRAREGESGGRIMAGLAANLLRRQRFASANAYDVEDKLRELALSKSAPFYNEAFEQVVTVTPRMQQLLKHPKLRAAYDLGAKLARDEDLAGTGHGRAVDALPKQMDMVATLIAKGVDPAKAAAFKGAGELTELPVRGLDYMKRGLDILIKRGLEGEKPTLDRQGAKALRAMLADVTNEARTQVGAYDRALTTYAGHAEAKTAVEAGREFARKAPEIVAREIKKLPPNQRDFYRIGALQALYERVFAKDGAPSNVAKKFFGGSLFADNGMRSQDARRIRALFGKNEAGAEAFSRLVSGEALISHATKRSLRLPRASQSLEQAAEGNVLPARGSLLLTAASTARQSLIGLRDRLSQQESDEIADLFSKGMTNPTELRALVDDLYGTYAGLAKRSMNRARVVTTLGQQIGHGAASETR